MNMLDERLQPCRFCGRDVAVAAKRCPNCGGIWPSPKARSVALAIVPVALVIAVALIGFAIYTFSSL